MTYKIDNTTKEKFEYSGEWLNGKRHGQGTMTYLNGDEKFKWEKKKRTVCYRF